MGVPHRLVFLVLMLTLGSQVRTGEIYGGHEAIPHSRPYMVLLECRHPNDVTTHCDGFLLNEDFVMTAAHCKARFYNALLGVHNYQKNSEQKIFVEKSFPHKEYTNAKILENDIMLLKLSRKANFTQHVRPIALAEAGRGDLSQPQSCLLSGWGRFNNTNEFNSDVLMEVNVTLDERCYCTKHHLYCSVGEDGPGEGDSGGPLVCEDGRAHGVVSFTYKLKSPESKIHAYTNISHFKDWIDGIMNGRVNLTKST